MYPEASFDQAMPAMDDATQPQNDLGRDVSAQSFDAQPADINAYETEEFANMLDAQGNERVADSSDIAAQQYETEEFANMLDEEGNERVADSSEIAAQQYETEEYANMLDAEGNERVAQASEQPEQNAQRTWRRGEIRDTAAQPYETEEFANMLDEQGNERVAQASEQPEQNAERTWQRGQIRDNADQLPEPKASQSAPTMQPGPMQREPQIGPKADPRSAPGNALQQSSQPPQLPPRPQRQSSQPPQVPPRPAAQQQPPPKYQAPKTAANAKPSGPVAPKMDAPGKAERSTFKAQVLGKAQDGGLLLKSIARKPGEREELIALPASSVKDLKSDKHSRKAIEGALKKGDDASPIELSNFNGKWSARDTSRDAMRLPKKSIA